MIILGAGMAGCLAARMWPGSLVLEAQDSLPRNHRAVLRFRSDAVSRATGIPFRRVRVHKAIWYGGQEAAPTPRLANLYSYKVLGRYLPRSIWELAPVDRYVAPEDFHERLAAGLDIRYGQRVNYIFPNGMHTDKGAVARNHDDSGPEIISTIPLNAMLGLTEEPPPEGAHFWYEPITVQRATIPDCDVHYTVYFPDPELRVYRATLTGDQLILEGIGEMQDPDHEAVRTALGMPQARGYDWKDQDQQYGKIAPIDEAVRRRLLSWLTTEWGIYSLGRFATWRNILLDDLLQDCDVIRRLITADAYEHRRLS